MKWAQFALVVLLSFLLSFGLITLLVWMGGIDIWPVQRGGGLVLWFVACIFVFIILLRAWFDAESEGE